MQSTNDYDKIEVTVKDLISVPDRVINNIAVDQSSLPDWVYPGQFCDNLLRNLALSLKDIGSGVSDSGVLTSLLQSLYSKYPDYVGRCEPWWQWVVTCPQLTRGLMARLETRARLSSVTNVLKHTTSPDTMHILFGESVGVDMILSLVTSRAVSWCSHDHVWCLVSYLARLNCDTVLRTLVSMMSVWSDSVEIDQGRYRYLLTLAWTVTSALGQLSGEQLASVKDTLQLRLMSGMGSWLEADPVKRQLGMVVATVMLERLDSSLPEWTLEDTETLVIMRSLATPGRQVDQVKYEVSLETWSTSNTLKAQHETGRSKPEKKVEKPVREDLDSDDSDSDDDDDLPAYDMTNDTPHDKDKKPLLYIRDIIDELANPESLQQEECLQKIPEFAVKRLQYEDPSVVIELSNLMLHLQNKFDTTEWVSMRKSALTSVIVCAPVTCAGFLTKRMFDREVTLDTKFTILDSLVTGGTELRDGNRGELCQYVKTCVDSLCDGGGGAWARIKIAGLETSLVTQTVIGVASLVKLGQNTPSWHRQLASCCQLLLAVAGTNSRRPVQAAVLHSLASIAALIEPSTMLRADISDMLAQCAGWAGTVGGDLAEVGQQTMAMLQYKHTEMLKYQMETELTQSTQLKMRVDTPDVRIQTTKLF